MNDTHFFISLLDWLQGPGLKVIGIIIGAYIVDKIADLAIGKGIQSFIEARQKDRDTDEVRQRAKTLRDVSNLSTSILFTSIAIMMILPEFGISIGPLLTGAGVVGLAIGFGAQNLVRDFFSGLFIIIEDQYVKGDVIKAAGVAGVVEDVNLRRTVLRDLDGKQHHIPNGEITTVSNYSKDWSQMNINISVDYTTNIDRAVAVINQVGESLYEDPTFGPFVTEKPQVLGIDNFGDSSIDIKVIAKTKPLKQWDVTRAFRLKILQAFNKEGITIPFPHRTIIERKEANK